MFLPYLPAVATRGRPRFTCIDNDAKSIGFACDGGRVFWPMENREEDDTIRSEVRICDWIRAHRGQMIDFNFLANNDPDSST